MNPFFVVNLFLNRINSLIAKANSRIRTSSGRTKSREIVEVDSNFTD